MNKISTTTTVGMAQINVKRGDIVANLETHYAVIDEADKYGVDVLIFPELSLTGYEPDLAQSLAIDVDSNILAEIKLKAIRYNMTIMVGAPKLTNSSKPQVALFIIDNSGVVTTYSKMYLHHGEDVYFSSGHSTCQRTINNLHYSLAICADASNERHVIESIIPQSKFYLSSVLISHAGLENDLARLQEYARKYNLIVGMANFTGDSGGYHCAGNSGFYNSDGEIITKLPSNATGIAIITYYDDSSVIGKSISINNKVIAVKEHISNYPTPITLTRGVKVRIEREDTLYAGWLFCTNSATGISGWCPKQIIKQTDTYTGISLENYSANELNVEIQQQLLLIRELNDWAWCFDGIAYGWIPLANLQLYN